MYLVFKLYFSHTFSVFQQWHLPQTSVSYVLFQISCWWWQSETWRNAAVWRTDQCSSNVTHWCSFHSAPKWCMLKWGFGETAILCGNQLNLESVWLINELCVEKCKLTQFQSWLFVTATSTLYNRSIFLRKQTCLVSFQR